MHGKCMNILLRHQVREELRMYNPQYTARPHVVVLNKMDMEDAFELEQELRAGIVSVSNRPVTPRPWFSHALWIAQHCN